MRLQDEPDLGGKRSTATVAGLVDGAQYVAAGIIALTLGELLDRFTYEIWPLAALPFAVLGALLLATQRWRRALPASVRQGGRPRLEV